MSLSKRNVLGRYTWFILILLLAFSVRMWDINARSLWFDEAVEYWSAAPPLWLLPRTVLATYQPPLYTFLLHMWLKVGMEAVWLRFLSVVFSMLTLVGVTTWGYRLFGLRGALIAAGITALLPSEVRYAQEIGEYALMVCVLTWALYFLDRAFRGSGWKFWSLWGFFSIVSVYSHYGTSLVVVPLAAISLFENLWHKRQRAIFQQVVVAAISLLLGLPILGYFLPQQIPNLTQSAFTKPGLSFPTEAAKFVNSVGNTFLFQLIGWPYSTLPGWIGEIVIALIFILCLLSLVGRLARTDRRVLWWLLVAYLSYFVAIRSGLYAYGNYGFRYGLILVPLFILAIVAAVEQLIRWKQTIVAFMLFSVIVGLAIYSLPNQTLSQFTRGEQSWPETQDLREVTRYWMEHRDNNDPTYVYYGAVPAFRYYLRLYGLDAGSLPPDWMVSCWEHKAEASCSTENIFYGAWFRSRPSEEKLLSIQETIGDKPEHLWLIFSHISPGEDRRILQGILAAQYAVALSYERPNASAYLLERR